MGMILSKVQREKLIALLGPDVIPKLEEILREDECPACHGSGVETYWVSDGGGYRDAMERDCWCVKKNQPPR